LFGVDGAVLQNDENFIVNCYDVVSPIPDACKSDINECYCVEKFARIYILEVLFVRGGEIENYLPTFYQIQQCRTVNSITVR
jgi:hypothetical protein